MLGQTIGRIERPQLAPDQRDVSRAPGVADIAAATVEIIQALQQRGLSVTSVEPYTLIFSDVFMWIVGGE